MPKDGIPAPPPRSPLRVRTSGPVASRRAATPAAPEDARHRILLIGFGHVGRALARRLHDLGHSVGVTPWRVVGIVDSRGAIWDERGVDLAAALETKEATGRLGGGSWRCWGALEAIRQVRPDVVVEVSVTNSERGEPGASHVLAALAAGADVVASNKGPFALRYDEVRVAAERTGREVRFGTTVGGIVPILETLVERLPGAEVEEVRAVLNGTTQFILSEIAEGRGFDEAVVEAQERGFTEPDPSWDLEGHDAALKAAIVHNCLFSPAISAAEVGREGLRPEVVPAVRRARQRGRALVLRGHVRPGSARVALEEVARDSPWAASGATNTFEVRTRRAGTLLLQGRGAGAEETAAGILADLAGLRGSHTPALSPARAAPEWLQGAAWPPVPSEPRAATEERPKGPAAPDVPAPPVSAAEVRAW
jgi:homoserine dehydrogenase